MSASDTRKWAGLSVLAECRKPMERRDPWNDWDRASASQLKTYKECPRKWFISKILGVRTPGTEATRVGTRVHEAIEDFINYGKALRDPVALPAKDWLWPIFLRNKRTDDIKVEKEFEITFDGFNLSGKIDIAIFTDATIVDHKTTSAWKWAMNEEQLAEDIQVHTYAYVFFQQKPEANHVKIVYNYMKKKKGKAQRLVTIALSREANENFMRAYILPLLQGMEKDATKVLPLDVSPNEYSACGKYGGCPFRDFCHARKGVTDRHETRTDYVQARRKKNDETTTEINHCKSRIRWRELEERGSGGARSRNQASKAARGFGSS